MAILKMEIDFDSNISSVMRSVDGKKVLVPRDELLDFITGKFGDIYVNLHIPHDGVMMELHAKKLNMAKKAAIFDMMPTGDGEMLVQVKGVFKVDAYAHVAERVKASKGPIYVTGVYAGDWPPVGGELVDYDKEAEKSNVEAQLV